MTNKQQLPESLQRILDTISQGLDEKIKVTKEQYDFLGKLMVGYMLLAGSKEYLEQNGVLDELIVKLDSHWESCFDVDGE